MLAESRSMRYQTVEVGGLDFRSSLSRLISDFIARAQPSLEVTSTDGSTTKADYEPLSTLFDVHCDIVFCVACIILLIFVFCRGLEDWCI